MAVATNFILDRQSVDFERHQSRSARYGHSASPKALNSLPWHSSGHVSVLPNIVIVMDCAWHGGMPYIDPESAKRLISDAVDLSEETDCPRIL